MNCPICERPLEEGMRFCPYCGHELSGRRKRRSILKMLLAGICAAALVVALVFVSAKLLNEYGKGQNKPAREAAALSIKPESYLKCIYPNEPVKILTELYPEDAELGKVIWSSSDESVATVDAVGNVRFLCVGTAVITATLENGVTASTTLSSCVRPYRLTFPKQSEVIEVGHTMTLAPIIAPADAQYSKIEWRSSDEKVLRIESDGKITAVSEGRATVTATVAGDVAGKTDIFVYRYPFDVLMNHIYEHGVYDPDYEEYFILLDYAETRMEDGVVINKRTYISLFPESDQLVLYCDVYSSDGSIYYETLVYFGRIRSNSALVQFYCDCDGRASSRIEDIPMSAIGGRMEVNAKGAINPLTFTAGTHIEFDTYEGDEGFRNMAEQITDELVTFSLTKLKEKWGDFGIGFSIAEVLGLNKL